MFETQLEKLCESPLAMFKEFIHFVSPHTITFTQQVQYPFRPTRFAMQRESAKFWEIVDIHIGNRTQLIGGGLPAEVFTMPDSNFQMDTAQTGMNITIIVRNISDVPRAFMGAMLGRGINGSGQEIQAALGFSSPSLVPPVNHLIALQLDDTIHKFTREECGGFEYNRQLLGTGDEKDDNLRLLVDCTLNPRMVSLHYQDGVLFGIEERSNRRILEIDPSKNRYLCSLEGVA